MRNISYTQGTVTLLDQRKLPISEEYLEVHTPEEMVHAIQTMAVRGAPAIGIAAAYGLCLSVDRAIACACGDYLPLFSAAERMLRASRPTAVNLFYALDRMVACVETMDFADLARIRKQLLREADGIAHDEAAACAAIGESLLSLLRPGMGILTHCNAGGIATVKYGTALAPILLGAERGIHFHVYADETRPLLQGSRLTAWELARAGVDVTVICDNMAAQIMREGKVDAVILGCDRIAANGDAANKIGSYGVAILAKYHGIPLYVAGPQSTIDLHTATGATIEIEERAPEEISCGFGKRTAPEGVHFYNPAFDVIPGELISAIITEKGILRPPYASAIAAAMQREITKGEG